MISVQSAMNQLLGSAGSLAYQITAPKRYATAQEQSIKNVIDSTRAKEETKAQVAQEQAKQTAGQETEAAKTALATARDLYRKEIQNRDSLDMEEIVKTANNVVERSKSYRDKLFAEHRADPSNEDIKQKYRMAEEVLNELEKRSKQLNKIQATKEAAEASALDSIQTKTEGHTEQKNQLEQRIEMLKQLNQEGVMSNTQTKKYIHKIGGNQ